jgi:phosphatidate cytidylyltransferase
MHLKRLIVAAVLLPALYFYVMYLPQKYFFLLLAVIGLLSLSEFFSMYMIEGFFKYLCIILGISVLGISYSARGHLLDGIVISIMAIILMRLLFRREPVAALYDIAPPVVGLLYIPVLLSFQMGIRNMGSEWIIFLYATVWASDSMAYYVGKGMGKRKLYREVSPNKTVAGAVGSVIGGAAGALLLKFLIVQQIQISSALAIGTVIGSVSILGDLVESMFKRDAGVKDSGVVIPGHGGILDKIDGSLFAGPVLYWILIMMNTKSVHL